MSYVVSFWTKVTNSRGLLFLSLVFLFSIFHFQFSIAQSASIAFWNVENLYDTIPSRFYDDREWTPRGENRWDTERYRAKIDALARVIDDLGADIVGLAEVENETVVRDLVRALRTDYNYIHRTSGDSRGIDLALLYKGDRFFPDGDPGDQANRAVRLIPSGMGREFLGVRGELSGERVEIVVCHLASRQNPTALRRRNMEALRRALETMLGADPAAAIIVMGDMNAAPDERLVRKTLGPVISPWDFMYSPHSEALGRGQGSYNYRSRWLLYDWMAVSPAIARGATLRLSGAGIYAREHLTEPADSGRRPRRTFYAGEYEGGPSDHFPVWIEVAK